MLLQITPLPVLPVLLVAHWKMNDGKDVGEFVALLVARATLNK